MLRPSITTAAIALLCTGALAQVDMKSKLRPITVPLKYAGVYHVATGTWTRGASLANVTGPDTIYNNSCSVRYFTGQQSNEQFQHRSRIPSTSGPTGDSIFYGSTNTDHRYDRRPGCLDEYTVNGFEFVYCSSHIGPFQQTHRFDVSWIPTGGGNCGTAPPTNEYNFVISGLPGAIVAGSQACWVVGVDLSGGSEMAFSGDGDGTYTGPRTADQFGWSFGPTGPVAIVPADFTGPVLAGNFTHTGGGLFGPQTPCTGTDGTIWDNPINSSEWLAGGTGMDSNDFFRIDPASGPPWSPSCIFFGGYVHSDFYLKMYAGPICPPPDPMTGFCYPLVGGVRSCPCGNPQVPALSAKGCDNLLPAPSGTGGAHLAASGVPNASVSNTLVFHVTGAYNPGSNSNLHIFWKGTSTLAVGAKSGFGVRCVGGALDRIYQGNGTGTGGLGSTNSVDFPNGVQTTDAWTASQMPGASTTLYYYDSFRDNQGPSNCFTANDRFNVSHAGSITWVP